MSRVLPRDGGGRRATRRHRGEVRGRRGDGGLRRSRPARGRRAAGGSRRGGDARIAGRAQRRFERRGASPAGTDRDQQRRGDGRGPPPGTSHRHRAAVTVAKRFEEAAAAERDPDQRSDAPVRARRGRRRADLAPGRQRRRDARRTRRSSRCGRTRPAGRAASTRRSSTASRSSARSSTRSRRSSRAASAIS